MKYIAILLLAIVSTSNAVSIKKGDQPPGTPHVGDLDLGHAHPATFADENKVNAIFKDHRQLIPLDEQNDKDPYNHNMEKPAMPHP